MPNNENSTTKKILTIIGTILIFTGIIMLFIPILPTSPFLAAGAICYMKGSKKMYNRLVNLKYIGPMIKNCQEKGLSITMKIVISVMLLISTVSVFIFFDNELIHWIALTFFFFAVLSLVIESVMRNDVK